VESPPLRRKRARMGHPGHPQSESFSCSGIAELRSAAQTRASGPTWVVGWAYAGWAYVGVLSMIDRLRGQLCALT
jgi:hypothetical protein